MLKNLSSIIYRFANKNPKDKPAITSVRKCTPNQSLDIPTIKIKKPKNIDKKVLQKGFLT